MPRAGESPQEWEGFGALRPGTRPQRILIYLVGPIMWVVALTVLVAILREDNLVEIGLLIALAVFVVAFGLLTLAHHVHARDEERR